MATYHCSVKVGGKGKASGHAAYIAREGRYAERTGYEDLEATGYGNLPAWAEDEPALFWAAADRHERANGATYREIEIALPRELDPAQRQELVLDFIRHEIGERHAHQWAIHNPGAALVGGECDNWHRNSGRRCWNGETPKTNYSTAGGRWRRSTSRSTSTHSPPLPSSGNRPDRPRGWRKHGPIAGKP